MRKSLAILAALAATACDVPETASPEPPTAPADFVARVKSPNRIELQWRDPSNETGVRVERAVGIEADHASFSVLCETAEDATSFLDVDVGPEETCHYRLRAFNDAGVSGYSATISVTTAIQTPTDLAAVATSWSEIRLSWIPGIDGSVYSIGSRYSIERCTDGASFGPVGLVAPSELGFSDAGLVPSTQYHYRVRVTTDDGRSSTSDPAQAVTLGPPPPPSPPSGLAAQRTTATTISLSWRDNSDDEDDFVVERSDDGGATFPALTSRPAGTTTHDDDDDAGAVVGANYIYRVCATNVSGRSAFTTAAPDEPGAWSALDGSAVGSGVGRAKSGSFFPAMGIDDSGRLYVAWTDVGSHSAGHTQLRLRMWDGEGGRGMGGLLDDARISDLAHARHPSIAVPSNGMPIIAFSGYDFWIAKWVIQVKRWTGSSWVCMGPARISDGSLNSSLPRLVLDANDHPIVA